MSEPTAEGDQPQPAQPRQLRVRRAPRYPVFLVTGALVGLLAALVAGLSGPAPADSGRGQLVGYLAITLGLVGALLGGLVAVVLDRGRR